MDTLGDYQTRVQELIHDTNAVDFTPGELTAFINSARERVALDLHCVRRLLSGNLITNQESYPLQGGVIGSTVVTGGSGYSNTAIVTFTPPNAAPAGQLPNLTATGTLTLASGVVTGITMTSWGSGYTSVPTASITDATGTAATANAITGAMVNVLDILSASVIWPGAIQSATLAWLPWTYFQAYCRANRNQFRYPSVWSNYTDGNTLYFYPIPDQAYLLEIDAIVLPSALVASGDVDTQIVPPNGDAVKWYAAHLALLKMQNFEHAEYYAKKYQNRAGEILRTKQDRRMPNVYRNSFRRLNRW